MQMQAGHMRGRNQRQAALTGRMPEGCTIRPARHVEKYVAGHSGHMGRIPEGSMAERILAHWQERQVENKHAGGKNCQQEGQLVRAKFS
jgi:hypothetical protein